MSEPRIGSFVAVAGRAVHYHDVGDGPPILLLHGWSSLAQEVLPPFLPLAGTFRLIAPDRPGYGFSDPPAPGREGPDGQAEWLAGILDALGIATVALVAHSLGAGIALTFAARHPARLRGLTLIGGFCRPTPHAAMPLVRAAIAPYIGPVIRETLVPAVLPYLGPWFIESALRPNGVPDYLADFPFRHAGSPQALAAMATELLAFNLGADGTAAALAALSVPVTVVHGATDAVADPAWHLPFVKETIPAAVITLLDGVGHAPHHARPEAVLGAVRQAA